MKKILWIGKYNECGVFDSDNIVFDLPDENIVELVHMLVSVQENVKICLEYKYDIDGIVEDDWIPIGI